METTVLTVIIHPIEIVSIIHSFIHAFIHSLIQKVTFVFYPSKTAVQAAERLGMFKHFFSQRTLLFLHNMVNPGSGSTISLHYFNY